MFIRSHGIEEAKEAWLRLRLSFSLVRPLSHFEMFVESLGICILTCLKERNDLV